MVVAVRSVLGLFSTCARGSWLWSPAPVLTSSDGLLLTIEHTVLFNQDHDEKQNITSTINKKHCLQDSKCNEARDFQIIQKQNKRALKEITGKYFKLKGMKLQKAAQKEWTGEKN